MKTESNPQVKLALEKSRFLAEQATKALLDEARLSPKPGLVDGRSSGAHKDLSLALMERSAYSLTDTFYAMALVGWRQPITAELRSQIGRIGREGERAMLAATQGVNTHRGAIWALGLLVTVLASIDGQVSAQEAALVAGQLASFNDSANPIRESKGLDVCRRFKVPGAREEAQQGFPHIINYALPTLLLSRKRGDSESCARVNALLAIMCSLSDTCVLSRGGISALAMMQQGAKAVLDAGGLQCEAGKAVFSQLEKQMLNSNLSPGGAADLLAATLLLDRTTRVNESMKNKRILWNESN